jgi:large subunit ribosomal protein L10
LAISKARKEELVTQYMDLISRSEAIFIAEYGGMSVKSLEALREKVREVDGAVHVTKNTLLSHALQESDRPVPAELLLGPVATGFATGDVVALAKTLVDYARTEDKLTLKGAILGKDRLSPEQVEALAKLPPLEQIRAQLLGMISAPAQNIASALANGVRQVVNVIDAYAKSEDGDGGDASTADAVAVAEAT